jgi:hypothetical protein
MKFIFIHNSQEGQFSILVYKVVLGRLFAEHFVYSLSVSLNQCSRLIFSYMLLLAEEQMGTAW